MLRNERDITAVNANIVNNKLSSISSNAIIIPMRHNTVNRMVESMAKTVKYIPGKTSLSFDLMKLMKCLKSNG